MSPQKALHLCKDFGHVASAIFHTSARAKKRADVNADTERQVVEPQRNAPAKVDLQIEKADRLELHAGIEPVVSREARVASLNARGCVAAAIRGGAACHARPTGAAPEHSADDGLRAPGGYDIAPWGPQAVISRVFRCSSGGTDRKSTRLK